ncbi:RNase Gf29 [Trametes cingulata]|nr:RNase Gf29 [Trametes cingulata]
MFAAIVILGALAGSAFATGSTSGVEYEDLFKRISSGCSTTGPASCQNTTEQIDLCCFEAPGGNVLQTQLWDTNPPTGPTNSWTIHGLWPDHCDGTFNENCDPSRYYTDLTGLLAAQGANDTLAFMQEFWVDIHGQNEQFWEHEWNTHGTCYSTLNPSCLPPDSPKGAEAVAFFQTVVNLFKTLPTYDFLAQGGITPSTSKTYTLSALTDALKAAAGVTPVLNCGGGTLTSIEWYFNVKGSIIDGEFIPIDAPSKGSCPSTGIKYPPKTSGTTTSTSTSASSSTTATGVSGSLPSKATIQASSTGGLLSGGTWSTQTLATYHFTGTTASFTMSTSKGNCGVSDGKLTCGSGVSPSTFSAVTSGGNLLLAFSGSTAFSSDSTPSGSDQEAVFAGSSHSNQYTLAIVPS